jgi:hypothetical protein
MSASDKPLDSKPAITNDLPTPPNPHGTEASAISGKKRFVVLSNVGE